MRLANCLQLLCILSIQSINSQSFYDQNKIQEVKIYFDYQNWDYRLDTAKAGKENYILSTYCLINGVRFDSIGVKYKGNSSYRNTYVKNPLHIKLDWVIGSQDYENYTSLKFGNNAYDPSVVREVLSYDILSNYMDCPKANYISVYINDTYLGLYSNVEAINKKFCNEHFNSSDHVFAKGNPDRPSNNSTSNLVYANKDSASYYIYYGMENGYGWYKLIALMDTLKNNANALPKIMDIDRALWMHAFNSTFSNYDSYTGSFSQNYYLYEDDFGRFLPIVWDLNMSIGGFPGNFGGAGGATLDKMPFFNGETNAARPLIQKILQNPRYKKMYTAHIRTFCKEFIANKEYQNITKRLQSLIDSTVQTDLNSLTTYSAFQTSLTAAISSGGVPGGSAPGINTLMDARLSYFNTINEFKATPPKIENITVSNSSPNVYDTVWVSAKITDVNYTYIGFRNNRYDIFIKNEMFDDGLHHDGQANDGIFGGYIYLESKKTQYYIYAENNLAGQFSPERAEYEYHIIEATIPFPNVLKGEIVINELMSSNRSTVLDTSDMNYEDWVELYNNGNTDTDLSGFYLSDDFTKLDKWEFPKSSIIPSHGRIVLWLDEDSNSSDYHTNFKISSQGEQIILTRPDGLIIDSLRFGIIPSDQSFERCPDGIGTFKITTKSTYNTMNCIVSSIAENNHNTLFVYPNPASDIIRFELKDDLITQVSIYDLKSKRILNQENYQFGIQQLSIEHLNQGIYLVEVKSKNGVIEKLKLMVLPFSH